MNNKVKQALIWISAMMMLLTLCACGSDNVGRGSSETNAAYGYTSTTMKSSQTEAKSLPMHLKKTDVASQKARYLPVEKVGTYNKNIITDGLKAKLSALPEASNSSIPYWTGFASENKIFKNFKDERWQETTDGSTYFYEQQIKFIADEGFNCARILYSLSFLSNPDNILEVNEAEVEQLDELISWGMKYDVHIMLSFTGLPGKAGTSVQEENVQSNDELFKNPELAEMVKKYLVMLAGRYADIPNRNLSFELLAEPAVPECSLNIYTKVLTPIVKSMWKASPHRILIVSDVAKQVPEQMAALGCCLSLHNHIYTVDSSRLDNIDYNPSWPMEYLPGVFNSDNGQTLTLQSETEFNAGTISMYIDEGNIQIIADGKVLLPSSNGHKGWVEMQFRKGTKEIGIKAAETYVHFSAVKIKSDGKEAVTLVIHDLYTGSENNAMPTILIKDDGTTQNIDNPQKLLNAKFFTSEYLQKFIDCAKKYNVGFLETEVGTDTHDLNKEEYKAYHGEWLKAFKDNHIPWMYNCLHGVLAPYSIFESDNQFAAGYTDVAKIDGTPLVKNIGILEMLREYK
jgi:beta-glucosidase/6-phospho-beta-glucosidase/beta-galactosidase